MTLLWGFACGNLPHFATGPLWKCWTEGQQKYADNQIMAQARAGASRNHWPNTGLLTSENQYAIWLRKAWHVPRCHRAMSMNICKMQNHYRMRPTRVAPGGFAETSIACFESLEMTNLSSPISKNGDTLQRSCVCISQHSLSIRSLTFIDVIQHQFRWGGQIFAHTLLVKSWILIPEASAP